ncbi:hypothetical protein FS837_005067 [Tulasnella sp. UAMH 9824]|nr:hypothetical protein FS837_005067 [Tulasnella sp. UAMH 9824]
MKPFQCLFCGKEMATQDDLLRHTNSRASRKDGVTAHLRRRHRESTGLKVLTFLRVPSPATQSSTTGDLGRPPAPTAVTPPIPPPQFDAFILTQPQFPLNDQMPIPQYWMTYQWVPVVQWVPVATVWSDQPHL